MKSPAESIDGRREEVGAGGRRPGMKILVVSWYMPPYNTMGALRVGKLCKYLHQQGHDVRVLSCADLPFAKTLALEIPDDRVVRTGSLDINAVPKAVQKLRVALGGSGKAPAPVGAAPAPAPENAERPLVARRGPVRRVLRSIRRTYEELFNFPDAQIGWFPDGLRDGRRLLAGWRPDLVFASAPPFTTLMIGRSMSRRCGAPMVVEYRDRLYEDPYTSPGPIRKAAEKLLEDWWMKEARGIVTVSDPWAEDYRARYGLPVATVYNGFDPDDFPADYPRGPTDPDTLRIVYTGILYPERRDPTPLFKAIRLCGEDAANIKVAFYGAHKGVLETLAARHGVSANVEANERVPYAESIGLQMNADILLLLQWNDSKEAGNVPGKVFEYIGARRPVLGIGIEDGVPARILAERGAGVVVNDPAAIAGHLRRWLAEKRSKGPIPLLPMAAREGLSRPEQYRSVEAFFRQIVGEAG